MNSKILFSFARVSVALTFLLLLGTVLRGDAQNFAVDRFVLSGGGGTSTNSQFGLNGTVGQSDAVAKLAGGSYTLEGGFWSVAVAVQMPGAPRLTITRLGGTVVISWPAENYGYVLEVTGSVRAPAVWIPVSNVENNSFTTPCAPGTSYFRLRKP